MTKQSILKVAQTPNQTTAKLLKYSTISKVIVPLNLLMIVAFTFYDTFLTSPQFRCCDYDLNVFRYIGMIIARGGSPYLDVFDHKPPLIYIFTALTYPLGPWGFWIFERIIVSLTSIALYLFLRKRNCPWPFAQTLIFLCLMGLPTIYISSGFTRLFTACFNLLAFLLLRRRKELTSRR